MPETLGQAYVQILPTTEGIQGQMTELLGGPAQEAGGKAGGDWSSGFSKALQIGGAVAKPVIDAVADIGKQAFDSYSEYEQLTGGIETLFGDSAATVIAQAGEAYKTAGMDANAYMETSIQSAAAMINSLGGDQARAAELMGLSITDMSDNVNKMGTSMEAVEAAYRGFSRGNFVMLDNLALGYSGSREGMEQLLEKAEELSGVEYDISSYSDIVQAIHVVQTEMGITGTTAREASETISGSTAAAKAAWSNLVTGLADENADIETLVDNFVDSAITAGENILPRIGVILEGVGTLIGEGAEKLIPIAVDTLIEYLPQLTESGAELLGALVAGVIRAIPQLVLAAPDIISALVRGLVSAWPEIRSAGRDAIDQLWQGIQELAANAWQWGKDLIKNFVDGIIGNSWLVRTAIGGITDTIEKNVGFSEPEEGPLSNFHTYAPDMMALYAQGIRDNTPMLQRQVEQSFDFRSAIRADAVLPQAPTAAATPAQRQTQPRQVVIPLYLDRTELGRVVLDLYNTESARLGLKLTGGASA